MAHSDYFRFLHAGINNKNSPSIHFRVCDILFMIFFIYFAIIVVGFYSGSFSLLYPKIFEKRFQLSAWAIRPVSPLKCGRLSVQNMKSTTETEIYSWTSLLMHTYPFTICMFTIFLNPYFMLLLLLLLLWLSPPQSLCFTNGVVENLLHIDMCIICISHFCLHTSFAYKLMCKQQFLFFIDIVVADAVFYFPNFKYLLGLFTSTWIWLGFVYKFIFKPFFSLLSLACSPAPFSILFLMLRSTSRSATVVKP